jgi:hypothetical protein
LDDYRLVLNKGSQDGITSDDRFLVFALGEELTDPLTRESLGKLEIVKGRGRPAHIQERMTTIISDRFTGEGKRRIVKRSGGGLWSIGAPSEEEIIEPGSQVREAFDNPKVGDMVKKLPR